MRELLNPDTFPDILSGFKNNPQFERAIPTLKAKNMPRAGFNPRKLMEHAIEVMKSSIHETRDDGKSSPAVGAVLYMPDGKVETAYRGELREGDHAEFTLLERKKRDARLDGSVLFATLEPCAPGARGEGKLPCAERIVLARIKEVWIGIEDPDPKVDRKASALEALNQDEKAGWKYLTTQLISTAQAYAEELGFDERKTQRHLRKFMELGMIRRIGQGRATRYEVVMK